MAENPLSHEPSEPTVTKPAQPANISLPSAPESAGIYVAPTVVSLGEAALDTKGAGSFGEKDNIVWWH